MRVLIFLLILGGAPAFAQETIKPLCDELKDAQNNGVFIRLGGTDPIATQLRLCLAIEDLQRKVRELEAKAK